MACDGCRKAVHGARGITVAVLGLDRVERQARLSRQVACDACDQRRGPMCDACHCVVAAKIRVASESCPMGHWQAEEFSRV